MRKSTLIGCIVVAALLLGACVYGYVKLYNKPQQYTGQDNTYTIVPLDAVLVQHFSHIKDLFEAVDTPESYFAQYLNPTNGLNIFLGQLNDFASANFPQLLQFPALCSLHDAQRYMLGVLFGLALDDLWEQEGWPAFLANTRLQPTTTMYNNVKVYNLYDAAEPLFVAFVNNVLIASSEQVVLESSIRHLKTGGSLLDNPQFAQIVSNTLNAKPSRLFIAHNKLPKLFAAYMGRPLQTYASFCSTTASWTALDGDVGPNSIQMDGYSILTRGVQEYFTTFVGQEAQNCNILDYLPANSTAGIILGLSDFQTYLDKYKDYLEVKKSSRQIATQERIEWFDLLYPVEVAVTCVPFQGRMEWLGVIESQYINQAKIQYALLNKQRENEVMDHTLPNLFKELFGPVFGLCQADSYYYEGSCILYGSKELLEDIHSRHQNGNFFSLSQNLRQTPAGQHVMDRANATLFVQPVTALDSLRLLVDSRYQSRLDSLSNYNAQYAFFQFSAVDTTIYTHMLLYGANQEQSPLMPKPKVVRTKGSVHQDSLQVTTGPYTVQNHYTKKQNTLEQTAWPDCKLVLKDHNNKTLWTLKMEGPVQDKVAQIDFLNNNKLQLLFAEGNRLYLVDRLGRHVAPYPKSFMESVSFGPYVFDVQDNKEYQIFLVHHDGVLRAYNKFGKPLSGWTDFTLPDYIVGEIRSLIVDKVPYWVVFTNSQTVFLSYSGETVAMLVQKECLDPTTEIEIFAPGQVRGTTIEGKEVTINLN